MKLSKGSSMRTNGIHHVTAIAGDPQENLDFYAGALGMRLVKRSVNQDDPGSYHLFYADAEGRPGTDLTFFPWTRLAPRRPGVGLTSEVALAAPAGSLGYWAERLERYGVKLGRPQARFGEQALPFRDPHGLALALVEIGEDRPFSPWEESPVPAAEQLRGIHALRALERDLSLTARFLTEVMGFTAVGDSGSWRRFSAGGGSGSFFDVQERPQEGRGQWGTGSVHHVAWRVPDEEAQEALRERVAAAGRRPSDIIDRFWFKSVYFMEPGGVLFELATDGPGFAVDEDPARLGEGLVLPPWLEPSRRDIEAALPPLRSPRLAAEVGE
jgi:glyoxalase family protein